MTKSDCTIGQYYSWFDGNKEKPWCTIKYTNESYASSPLIIGGPSLYSNATCYHPGNAGGLHIPNRDIRIATPEEKAWLDACILAGEWVEKPKLQNLPIFN